MAGLGLVIDDDESGSIVYQHSYTRETNSSEANDVGPILYKTKEQDIYVILMYIHMDYDKQDYKLKTIPTRH